jgi:hypothetical protein
MSFITIEASHIYFRGGFVLLEQILDYCEENRMPTKVYLGYKEVYQYFIEKEYQYLTLEQTTGAATIFRDSLVRNVIFLLVLKKIANKEAFSFFSDEKEKEWSIIF